MRLLIATFLFALSYAQTDSCKSAAKTNETCTDTVDITKSAEEHVRIYEYTSAANPDMSEVPLASLAAREHESGETRIIPFDLSSDLRVPYPATSPNLMASFLRIKASEHLQTEAIATSQMFYVIRGSGSSESEYGVIRWSEGDLFVLPSCSSPIDHIASSSNDAALYWVTDEPLMQYLGVAPRKQRFQPTVYTRERMLAEVERVKQEAGASDRNRMGILLGNEVTEAEGTKTLSHTLWALLNMLPAGDAQRPHRHNSVALDLCVSATTGKVYTMMGPELDENGWVKNPVRRDWTPGSVFITPPGWWHSHHNESDEPAWVLPIQDAGMHTHMRTLDITFAPTFPVEN